MWFRGKQADAAMVPKEPAQHQQDATARHLAKRPTKRRQRQVAASAKDERDIRSRKDVSEAQHGTIAREQKKLAATRRQRKERSAIANAPKKQTPAAPHHRRVVPSKATKEQAKRQALDSEPWQAKATTKGNTSVPRSRLTTRRLFVVCAIAIMFPLVLFQDGIQNELSFLNLRQSPPQKEQETHDVHFIHAKRFDDDKDLFSASWLQPLSTFLDFDTSGWLTLQTTSAASYALFKKHHNEVRMTLDWLDFSVEHLSDYWDATSVLKEHDNVPFHVITSKCYEYIRNIWKYEGGNATWPMQDTIAVVAFEPCTNRKKPEIANELSVTSLAATVASLIQAGFGRVVWWLDTTTRTWILPTRHLVWCVLLCRDMSMAMLQRQAVLRV
jgi:hypothetical protein